MNIKEKQLLDSVGVYMSPAIRDKYNHRHTDPTSWCRFYYYKNRKPFEVPNSNVRYDSEVTSTNTLHRDTFYKMIHLSSSDLFYDFYYKLKDNFGSDVVIKKNKKKKKSTVADYNPSPPKFNDRGQVIVSFD